MSPYSYSPRKTLVRALVIRCFRQIYGGIAMGVAALAVVNALALANVGPAIGLPLPKLIENTVHVRTF